MEHLKVEASNRYSLFGLCLQSCWELELPRQDAAGAKRPDLELSAGSPALFAEVRARAGIKLHTPSWFLSTSFEDGSSYLLWPGLFEFLISPDGRQIFCRMHAKATWEGFQAYLLGQVLSFALLKQGIESLHCTALVLPQGAVGFIGDCGCGKSSLAAAFLQAGYPLLTDDLLVFKEQGHGFLAFPSFPRIKLFPGVARNLFGNRVSGVPMNPFTRKQIIQLGPGLSWSQAAPLKAIYVIRTRTGGSRSRRIVIRTLGKRRAFLDLISHTFNTVVKEPERLKRQFALAQKVTAGVPVKSLSYPRELSKLPEVVSSVVANLRW